MFALAAARGNLREALQVLAFVAHDADRLDIAELAPAHGERAARDLDGAVAARASACQRLEQPAGFFATSRAQLCYRHRQRQTRDDLRGVAAQQPHVGARQAIFGQHADGLEQRRADFVVQVFRGQFLLSRAGQPGAYLGDETVRGRDGQWVRLHGMSSGCLVISG